MEKPLYVILRRQWFDAFVDGSKTEEWRRYGAHFNEETCSIGRQVTLALGYTRRRMTGRIRSFRTVRLKPGDAACAIYGEGAVCAVFGVELD
jgi:hypothetical protein